MVLHSHFFHRGPSPPSRTVRVAVNQWELRQRVDGALVSVRSPEVSCFAFGVWAEPKPDEYRGKAPDRSLGIESMTGRELRCHQSAAVADECRRHGFDHKKLSVSCSKAA